MLVSALVAAENIWQKQLEGGRVFFFLLTREVRDEVAGYFVSMVVKEQRALSTTDSQLTFSFFFHPGVQLMEW